MAHQREIVSLSVNCRLWLMIITKSQNFFFCFVFYTPGDCWGNRQKARAHDHIVCCYPIPYRSICVVFVIQLYSGHCSMFNVCLHVIEELKINKTIYTSAAAPNSRIHCGVHRRRCGCCPFCISVFFSVPLSKSWVSNHDCAKCAAAAAHRRTLALFALRSDHQRLAGTRAPPSL